MCPTPSSPAAGSSSRWETAGGSTVWLYALNATTGHTEWPAVLGETPNYATVTYDGRDIFALTPDGSLTSYTASTGYKRWSVQLPYQSTFAAPPTAYDGVVYASGSGVGGPAPACTRYETGT
jgi:outer membrane protein assembly factor BamB